MELSVGAFEIIPGNLGHYPANGIHLNRGRMPPVHGRLFRHHCNRSPVYGLLDIKPAMGSQTGNGKKYSSGNYPSAVRNQRRNRLAQVSPAGNSDRFGK